MDPIGRHLPSPRLCLVTGGAGFIGSHLVDALLDDGVAVRVLDDLSSGALENLARHRRDPRLSVQIGDAGDPAAVARAIDGVDAVFHLAGAVGVLRLQREPVAMLERNLRPTEVVLAAAAERAVPTLIASSSEVYGQEQVPFREDAPVQIGATHLARGGYACAKAMGEFLALAHARQRGLPVVVARLFNTVGPRQAARHGLVLPRFVEQARRGAPITVYGDGRQRRCFAAVGEVVAALRQMLAVPRAHGQVVNVGSTQEVSIQGLAELVRQAAGSASPIVHLPLGEVFGHGFADPARRVPCLRRLRELLGWVPSLPVPAIVQGALDHALPAQAASSAS